MTRSDIPTADQRDRILEMAHYEPSQAVIAEAVGLSIPAVARVVAAAQNNAASRDADGVAGADMPRSSLNSPGASASGAFPRGVHDGR